MPEYKNFQNTKNKLSYLWNRIKSQEAEAKKLKKIVINLNDVAFTKNIYKDTIVNNEILSVSSGRTFLLDFPNFPSWAIPMTHFVPVLSLPDGFDIQNAGITYVIKKEWKEVGENHYHLKVKITGSSIYFPDFPALFLTVTMYIINERNYYLTQSEGI